MPVKPVHIIYFGFVQAVSRNRYNLAINFPSKNHVVRIIAIEVTVVILLGIGNIPFRILAFEYFEYLGVMPTVNRRGACSRSEGHAVSTDPKAALAAPI